MRRRSLRRTSRSTSIGRSTSSNEAARPIPRRASSCSSLHPNPATRNHGGDSESRYPYSGRLPVGVDALLVGFAISAEPHRVVEDRAVWHTAHAIVDGNLPCACATPRVEPEPDQDLNEV